MEKVFAAIILALAVFSVFLVRKYSNLKALNDNSEVKDKSNVIDSTIYKLTKDLEIEKKKRSNLQFDRNMTDEEIIEYYSKPKPSILDDED